MTKKNLNCMLMVKRIWHSEIEVIHGSKQKGEDEKMEEKKRSENVRIMRALGAAQNPEEMVKEQWVVVQVKSTDAVGLFLPGVHPLVWYCISYMGAINLDLI